MIIVSHEEFECELEKYMEMADEGEDIKVLTNRETLVLLSFKKYLALKDAEFRYDSVSK